MKPEFKVRFSPEKPGMGKFFGELEAEVMEIAWENSPVNVKRVQYFLNKKKKYAYTTIMTVMNRLHAKEYLTRTKQGHSFQYAPAVLREEFLKYALRAIILSIRRDFRTESETLFKILPGRKSRTARKPSSPKSKKYPGKSSRKR